MQYLVKDIHTGPTPAAVLYTSNRTAASEERKKKKKKKDFSVFKQNIFLLLGYIACTAATVCFCGQLGQGVVAVCCTVMQN
jgi:hypothetical protein